MNLKQKLFRNIQNMRIHSSGKNIARPSYTINYREKWGTSQNRLSDMIGSKNIKTVIKPVENNNNFVGNLADNLDFNNVLKYDIRNLQSSK